MEEFPLGLSYKFCACSPWNCTNSWNYVLILQAVLCWPKYILEIIKFIDWWQNHYIRWISCLFIRRHTLSVVLDFLDIYEWWHWCFWFHSAHQLDGFSVFLCYRPMLLQQYSISVKIAPQIFWHHTWMELWASFLYFYRYIIFLFSNFT